MQSKELSNSGFRLRSILIHSLWITILGIVLFRLATANTQQLLNVEIFAIAGTVLATAPWVVQLLTSAAIILSYNAGVCDLTWLVRPSSEESSRCRGSRAIEDGGVRISYGNELGIVSGHGRNSVINGVFKALPIAGSNGPQLQRNRTI